MSHYTKTRLPDGLGRGIVGVRGQIEAKRYGKWPRRRWWFVVCVGGRTWTDPQSCKWSRQIVKKAARLLRSTPNRKNRREIAALRRRAR